MNSIFSSGVIPILEKSLDAVSLRQNAIADNIANVNTPNYKKKVVSFEEELKSALGRPGGRLPAMITHPKHIPIGGSSLSSLQPQIHLDKNTRWRNDGNNVDIDVEMGEMAKNTIKYQALTQRISQKFSSIKTVLEGR